MAQTENNSKKTNLWFGEGQRYAQVPAAVLMDSRLAPRHLQILLVLMLHVNRVSGICDVSRETIADYTGFNIGTISTATKYLQKLGWLKKSRNYNTANTYQLQFPEFEEGALRIINNRRLPDDVYAEQRLKILATQDNYRSNRREKHIAEFVGKHEHLMESLDSPSQRGSSECSAVVNGKYEWSAELV